MRLVDSRGFVLRVLHGELCGAAPTLLRGLMAFPAALYSLLTWMRRWAYRAGLLRVHRVGVPVISVGNLTVGGTGKTPVTEWLARWLVRNDRRPAILSRGYRPHALLCGARPGDSDEALLLKRSLSNVPLYADPDRARAGREAAAAGADCLLLDDGFQHLRLHRDVNIVLVDALAPLAGGRVIPAGTLREPLSSLRDADALVLTRVDLVAEKKLAAIRRRLRDLAPSAPLLEAVHRPRVLAAADGSNPEPPDRLRGCKVYLFCGIGNPAAFLRTVESLQARIAVAHYLPDHFPFRGCDLALLAEECKRCGAEYALTTEKDAVKIGGAWPGPVPLRVLRVEIEFAAGLESLESVLRAALSRCN